MRRCMLIRLLILISAAAVVPSMAGEGGVSRVVLVLLRGAGAEQWGASGNPGAATPRMDRMARDSVQLTDFHTEPLAAPALVAVLTGEEPRRSGVWADGGGRHLFGGGVRTLAEAAREAGVVTAWVGTWGLGDAAPCRPQDHGFVRVCTHGGGSPGSIGDAWDNGLENAWWLVDGRRERRKGGLAAACFAEAQDFIGRNVEKPFFCVVSPPEAPMSVVDGMVGDLWDHVSGLGLGRSTLMVVTALTATGSGSGSVEKDGKEEVEFGGGRRGRRGEAWQGGHLVPCLWRWPDGVRAGTREGALASMMELAPTVAEAAGWKWQGGGSLAKLLRGGASEGPRPFLVVEAQDVPVPQRWRRTALLMPGWALVNGDALYDLRSDPGQRTAVSERWPERVKEMNGLYDQWWRETGGIEMKPVRLRCGGAEAVTLSAADWYSRGERMERPEDIERGRAGTGAWLVEVEEAGPMLVTLRRRPAGVAGGIADETVPAVTARLRAGTVDEVMTIPANAESVTFKVKLPAGAGSVQGWWQGKDGRSWGAGFVEIRREPPPPPPVVPVPALPVPPVPVPAVPAAPASPAPGPPPAVPAEGTGGGN